MERFKLDVVIGGVFFLSSLKDRTKKKEVSATASSFVTGCDSLEKGVDSANGNGRQELRKYEFYSGCRLECVTHSEIAYEA